MKNSTKFANFKHRFNNKIKSTRSGKILKKGRRRNLTFLFLGGIFFFQAGVRKLLLMRAPKPNMDQIN